MAVHEDVNQTVPLALQTLGYSEEQIADIVEYIEAHNTIEGAAAICGRSTCRCSICAFVAPGGTRYIPWRAHVLMMAAAQPFISGAISKTVNMPRESTPEDIAAAFMEGWKLGLKALAVYRDGSKESQPLSTRSESDKGAQPLPPPRRERLPDTRQSITHKFSVNGHEGYITVGLYPDGRPGELFITMAKEGSTIGGLMDCFGTAVSMSLQYGVPLKVYVEKFSHTRFEPQGITSNPEIRVATSIVDYIFRWLGKTFLSEKENEPPYSPGSSPEAEQESPKADAEPKPAAMKAGGQQPGPGAASATASSTRLGAGRLAGSPGRPPSNGEAPAPSAAPVRLCPGRPASPCRTCG